MQQSPIKIGMNRTGAQLAPRETRRTEQATLQLQPLAQTDGLAVAQLRAEYAADADPLGSVPPPGTIMGVVQVGIAKLSGKNPEVLLDKIGERLAFERTGVRLYEAFMVKCRVRNKLAVDVPLSELEDMCAAKARHFKLLADVLVSLGADPTAQSPCADACGLASLGVIQLLSDPRTSVAQCLEGLLTVELTDNAAWALLVQLARECGHTDAAEKFAVALEEEQRHLARVTRWLQTELIACIDRERTG